MKFFAPVSFLLMAMSAPSVLGKSSSDDVEGETTVHIDGVCEVTCEWGANLDRRALRVQQEPRFLEGRRLGVDMAGVTCSYLVDEGYSSDSDDDITFDVHLPFPDDWTKVEKTADGADDAYIFARAFVIKDGDGNTIAEGGLEVELKVQEDPNGDDVLVFDDQSLAVACN
mmetsp:Transcript_17854/g.43378  ORF Transcript_17854/g.43378 Transcript_17854/m.43378 type:complete len:170 (-) Transcript_17854:181-690(-)|eukprot:CAMPEP_0113473976 /NCGR_PEP_ID=MMETSP0014_2-20120614/18333_1 /TAXON_ID=2857 /ORGANISM="Nitzschia sp." /LENGTH=169 /DNA_ID=CAMNT_0000366783 /DNA_START=553 /DNA_END=1062 /DNA_ORIENTATION=+ /assembly_acc=CAM_ASM_000159